MSEDLTLRKNQPGEGLEMIGPFGGSYYKVCLDGYRVPFLLAYSKNAQQTKWEFILDERLAIVDIDSDIANQLISFVADAMAVGAGYKSFYDACQHQGERHNPFGTRMIGLEMPEAEASEETNKE